MEILIVIWCICGFSVAWTMIGYPIFLKLLDYFKRNPQLRKSYDYLPSVTILVVAHNEEKVIWEKLDNLITVDYPKEKVSIVVTSDYSTDLTNDLVERFINEHLDNDIRLHKTVQHKGKTNAQNEAVKLINSEIVVLTDANCYFNRNAIKELVSCMKDEKVKYVCGSTVYTNSSDNRTADSENTYWDIDSKCRDVESRIQSITAGDGNIYACRLNDYVEIPLIECHDSSFPVLFTLAGGRALFNPDAVSYEKAGENDGDEYKRKVRMNRNIFHNILPSIRILNIFKYKWFTLFWLSHRTCRYLLWLSHFLLLLINAFLLTNHWFWLVTLIGQIVFYAVAILGLITKSENKIIKLISYYSMTVFAQWHAVYNVITGKSKPTWSKAESTR